MFSFLPPASTVVSEQVSLTEPSLYPSRALQPEPRGRRDSQLTQVAEKPAAQPGANTPLLPQHHQRIFPLVFPFQQAPSLLSKRTKMKTKEKGSNPLNPSPPPSSPLRTSAVRSDVLRSPPSQQGTDKPPHVLQRHLIHYKFHKARLGEALGQKSKQTRQE